MMKSSYWCFLVVAMVVVLGWGTDVHAKLLNGTELFTLIPNRYDNAVSLPPVLQTLATNPQGQQAIEELVDFIKDRLGINLSPQYFEEVLEKPSLLLNLLVYNVEELYESALGLNFAYQKGLIPPANGTWPPQLLPTGFDLANISLSPIDVDNFFPSPPVEVVDDYLWKGFFKANISDEEALSTITLGLAFYQLSLNDLLNTTGDQTFYVQYLGENYTSVYDFVQDLEKKHGYSISSFVDCRTANFLPLWTKDSYGNWIEIPAPIMIKTGISNTTTGEAVIPAVHCEMNFVIEGDLLNTTVLFYESTLGLGYFPKNLQQLTSWVGGYQTERFSSADTLEMMRLGSLYQAINLESIEMFHLFSNGYGTTGVCVTAVATLLQKVYGSKIQFFPHMLDTNYVIPPIEAAIKASGFLRSREYEELKKFIERLPLDFESNPTIPERALQMLIWPEGDEPFETVVAAREILTEAAKNDSIY